MGKQSSPQHQSSWILRDISSKSIPEPVGVLSHVQPATLPSLSCRILPNNSQMRIQEALQRRIGDKSLSRCPKPLYKTRGEVLD